MTGLPSWPMPVLYRLPLRDARMTVGKIQWLTWKGQMKDKSELWFVRGRDRRWKKMLMRDGQCKRGYANENMRGTASAFWPLLALVYRQSHPTFHVTHDYSVLDAALDERYVNVVLFSRCLTPQRFVVPWIGEDRWNGGQRHAVKDHEP